MARTPRAGALVTFLTAVTVAVAGCSTDGATGPGPTPGTPDAAGASAESVQISTPDGETLAARVFGASPTVAVLAHMRGASMETWFDFAEVAARSGYQAIAFDFRGYGGSTGNRDTALDVDLEAVVSWAREAGADEIVVMGASMGGTAATVVAAQGDVDGLANLSGPGTFADLDAGAVAHEVTVPARFVAAEGDEAYAGAIRRMATLAETEPILLSGDAHGTRMFDTHPEELTDILLGLLDEVA